MPQSRLIIIGIVFVIIVAAVLLFTGVIPGLQSKTPPPVPLTVWGVFEDKGAFENIAKLVGPEFVVTYTNFNIQTYENDLVNALAAGKGPDIFMIHSSWLPKHYEKLVPVADTQLTLTNLRSLFPTVVEQDFAPDGAIFALPLYIDTLSLFYNTDHFDDANVPFPPTTWDEFQELIPKLRKVDAGGKIVRAGAAIGGGNANVNRASDLLSLLFLQSGVEMTAPDFGRATFAGKGKDTVAFYTKFGNAANPYYTWSDNFKNSIDGFADGSISMMINYAHQIPVIKTKNPFLHFAVSPVPQPANTDQKVSYASYWGLAVSNGSRRPISSWNFIARFLTNTQTVQSYTSGVNRIPALRSLVTTASADPELGPFASQVLTARSWPQVDASAV